MRISDWSSDVCSSDLFVVMARLLLPGKPELIRSVHFVHAKPDIAEQVREYFDFFQCPVYFEQEASCFVVANEVLREKLHHGDAFLKDILDLHARKLLQQQRTVSLPDEVRHLIRSMIASGSPSMAARSEERRVGKECVGTGRSR